MSYYPKQNNHMTSEIAQKKYHSEWYILPLFNAVFERLNRQTFECEEAWL